MTFEQNLGHLCSVGSGKTLLVDTKFGLADAYVAGASFAVVKCMICL